LDLVVGGGRYGTKAVRYLMARRIPCVIVDPDPECMATSVVQEGEGCALFVCGGLEEVYRIFLGHPPNPGFPAAPGPVAAGLASVAHGLRESPEGLQSLLLGIPPDLVHGWEGGSLYLSRNRGGLCIPNCPEPDTCPVTGEPRSIPLSSELRNLLPDAHVHESVQVAPGLGALRGVDVHALLTLKTRRAKVVVATACRCHGVVTVLEKAAHGSTSPGTPVQNPEEIT